MDHATYIYFTRDDCEACVQAFDPFKKAARKLRGIIRTFEMNCDAWNA